MSTEGVQDNKRKGRIKAEGERYSAFPLPFPSTHHPVMFLSNDRREKRKKESRLLTIAGRASNSLCSHQ